MDEFQKQGWVKAQVRKEYTQFDQNLPMISHIILGKIESPYNGLQTYTIWWPHFVLFFPSR